MSRAIERHKQGNVHVIPILLRPAHWKNAPFSTLQVLPTSTLPITRWPDQDEAFYDVVIGIEQTIQEMLSGKTAEGAFNSAMRRDSISQTAPLRLPLPAQAQEIRNKIWTDHTPLGS